MKAVYVKNTLPLKVDVDGVFYGSLASAAEEGFERFYKSGGVGTKTLKILAKGNVFSQAVVEYIDVEFNGDQLQIGSAIYDAAATTAITAAIVAAAGLGPISAIAVAAGTSLYWSYVNDQQIKKYF